MTIQFRIHSIFVISSKGPVLVGELLEGFINLPADYIEYSYKGQMFRRKILWIDEAMRVIPLGTPNVGVLLEVEDENEIIDLKNWEPKLTIATIFSTQVK